MPCLSYQRVAVPSNQEGTTLLAKSSKDRKSKKIAAAAARDWEGGRGSTRTVKPEQEVKSAQNSSDGERERRKQKERCGKGSRKSRREEQRRGEK